MCVVGGIVQDQPQPCVVTEEGAGQQVQQQQQEEQEQPIKRIVKMALLCDLVSEPGPSNDSDNDDNDSITVDDIEDEEDNFLFIAIDDEEEEEDKVPRSSSSLSSELPLCHQHSKTFVCEIIQDELEEHLELVNLLTETMNDIIQEKNELQTQIHQQQLEQEQTKNKLLRRLSPLSPLSQTRMIARVRNRDALMERLLHQAQTDTEHCSALLQSTLTIIQEYQTMLRFVEESESPSEYTDDMRLLLTKAEELKVDCDDLLHDDDHHHHHYGNNSEYCCDELTICQKKNQQQKEEEEDHTDDTYLDLTDHDDEDEIDDEDIDFVEEMTTGRRCDAIFTIQHPPQIRRNGTVVSRLSSMFAGKGNKLLSWRGSNS